VRFLFDTQSFAFGEDKAIESRLMNIKARAHLKMRCGVVCD